MSLQQCSFLEKIYIWKTFEKDNAKQHFIEQEFKLESSASHLNFLDYMLSVFLFL